MDAQKMYQLLTFNTEGKVSISIGNWEKVQAGKADAYGGQWAIRRYGMWFPILIAQSKNYGQPLPHETQPRIVNECFVDEQPDRTFIYFTAARPQHFESCLKLYKGTHLSIEGNVTLDNFEGFKRAVDVAELFLKQHAKHAAE